MAYGYGKAMNVYKTNSVNYASKEQLLLMLLDGAVKFSKMARQAIEDKDIQKTHNNITRTQDIFYELIVTLDMTQAGDWGQQLMNIYDFVVRRLTDANIKKDLQIIDEVIPLIEEVRDMWHEVYKVSKGAR